MRISAKVHIELSKSGDFLMMGWWSATEDYMLTDLGIPVVKRISGSSPTGYYPYRLIVSKATKGSWIAAQWQVVDNTDFMYMEQAYIEKLQAQVVTASRINALNITSRSVIAIDSSGSKISSMNEHGDGAYIQYYPSGRKRMEFGGGLIIYYNDNTLNTQAWSLGASGDISKATLDRWVEEYLFATDSTGSNVKVLELGGVMYKRFLPSSSSTYTSYKDLTVKSTVSDGTTPNNVGSGNFIPNGWYTRPGLPYKNVNDPENTYRRELKRYASGYSIETKEIIFTVEEDFPIEM